MRTQGLAKAAGKARPPRGLFLDRDIDRLRGQLAAFDSLAARGKPGAALDEFDAAALKLIGAVFGESSDWVEAYELARSGEAGSLLNLEDEAQEPNGQDQQREAIRQRRRVLETCVWKLESRRASHAAKGHSPSPDRPTVSDYMTEEVRSVRLDATLKEAGKLLQKYKIGLLFVDDDKRYVGVITESGLSRNAVAKGLDPNTTLVKTVMNRRIVSIEDNESIVEAVTLMKEHGIRHLAVTKNETVVGIISISDILRYYSGVA